MLPSITTHDPFVEIAQHELGCALMCRIMEEFSRQKLFQLPFSKKNYFSCIRHLSALQLFSDLSGDRNENRSSASRTIQFTQTTNSPLLIFCQQILQERLNHTAHKSQSSSVNNKENLVQFTALPTN
jgi:hypothetical protein